MRLVRNQQQHDVRVRDGLGDVRHAVAFRARELEVAVVDVADAHRNAAVAQIRGERAPLDAVADHGDGEPFQRLKRRMFVLIDEIVHEYHVWE